MAMRAKQLKKFGLKANDQGQVKADNSLLKQFVSIAEESGLCCNICREGYKFQPNKVCVYFDNLVHFELFWMILFVFGYFHHFKPLWPILANFHFVTYVLGSFDYFG